MSLYQEIRTLAEGINSRLPKDHPCRRGNGECCDQKDLVVTLGDAQIIEAGFRNGGIPLSVKEKAIQNAADRKRTYCPFFNMGERSCAIYEHRPVVCIAYGSGGKPNPSAIMREEPTIPVSEMQIIKMCDGCKKSLGEPSRIPTQDVVDSIRVEQYLEGLSGSLNMISVDDFALNVLSGRRPFPL